MKKLLAKPILGRRVFIRNTVLGLATTGIGIEKLFAFSEKEATLSKEFRPRYHFVVPDSKIGPFDPNAALYWKGRHHLFYIFTIKDSRFPSGEAAPYGHASSEDLVHWTFHPWALEPELGGSDGKGQCWSGDGFIWNGIPTIAYWGNDGQTCLATSNDDLLIHWEKHPGNPVIPAQPVKEEKQEGDHAPYIWKEKDTWYCIRGGYLPDEGDTVFLFKSSDLLHWEYLHILYHPQDQWTEPFEDMACPEFFKLEDKYILIGLSHARGCHYYIGHWENERFTPESHGRMNWPGGRYGAPETYVDNKKRRILWVWAAQGLAHAVKEPGVMEPGVMAIPRVLTLADDGKSLDVKPIEELGQLRGRKFERALIELPSEKYVSFTEFSGNCVELLYKIDPGNASAIEVQVLCSADGSEHTTINVDMKKKALSIDASRSSLSVDSRIYQELLYESKSFGDSASIFVQEAPFALNVGENLNLQIFVDRCMVEVFANGRQALCMQVYPIREDSLGIRFRAQNGNAKITRLQAWQMNNADEAEHNQ